MKVRLFEGTVGALVFLAAACGGEATPAPTTPAPASTVAPASTTETKAPEAKAWTPPDPPTAEATKRECAPLIDALTKGVADGAGPAERIKVAKERVATISEAPPLGPAQFDWCKGRAQEELTRAEAEVAKAEAARAASASPDGVAKKTIGHIAKDMVAAYERETGDGKHRLCPSAKPIPAKLDAKGASYTSKPADWNDPGWKCLKFELSAAQDFQYEVKVQGTTFTVVGRRGGADAVEYTLTGKVDGGRVIIAPQIDEKRTPATATPASPAPAAPAKKP